MRFKHCFCECLSENSSMDKPREAANRVIGGVSTKRYKKGRTEKE